MSGALKLAIIGGGPSAFYVASRLLQQFPAAAPLRIHIYDRLWAPHGLVRYGVAPDHPEVKVGGPVLSSDLLAPLGIFSPDLPFLDFDRFHSVVCTLTTYLQ